MSVDSLLAGLLSPRFLLTWEHYLNIDIRANVYLFTTCFLFPHENIHFQVDQGFDLVIISSTLCTHAGRENPAISFSALLRRQTNKLQASDLCFLCADISCCALRFGAGMSFLHLLWGEINLQ